MDVISFTLAFFIFFKYRNEIINCLITRYFISIQRLASLHPLPSPNVFVNVKSHLDCISSLSVKSPPASQGVDGREIKIVGFGRATMIILEDFPSYVPGFDFLFFCSRLIFLGMDYGLWGSTMDEVMV